MSLNDLLKRRIKIIKKSDIVGDCVVYVMSRDQRVADNHALLAAQKHALAKELPLVVVFCLNPNVGVRAREHYQFMLDGLKQVEAELGKKNIPLMMIIGDPVERINGVCSHINPDAVYFDFNPLRGPQNIISKLSKLLDCSVFVVDTHNVVPVWEASDKQEVAAYTMRPKIHRKFAEFLVEPEQIITHPHSWNANVQSLAKLKLIIDQVLLARPENSTLLSWKSGETCSKEQLEKFINEKLETYNNDRNNPSLLSAQSDLSPYLHFGQISALRVSLRLQTEAQNLGSDLHLLSSSKMPKPEDTNNSTLSSINALIEEMIVRKELADNYCYFQPKYDKLAAASTWASVSLSNHHNDPRQFIYTFEQLRDSQTHDPAWNAAQNQLRKTGKMHGYMRMYWAKKVLEWSPDKPQNIKVSNNNIETKIIENSCGVELPNWEKTYADIYNNLNLLTGAEWAIQVLVYFNDHYSIDGGDPNGYAGILWSIVGIHDRPWAERSIFGMIRYMNYDGLKRKFDIESYNRQWQ
ncbi:MAG: deoxyribodipyrimidine photo-lyase [Candidatus Saccharibacteria bacterium]|nr:deoxyribodipyrimidine photo-lyase [Candidatus Saccharibacteria bacterium]